MARVGYNLPNPTLGAPSAPVRLWDCGTCWAHLEPEPGVWNWVPLDQAVAAARGPVLLVLGHPAVWAADGGPDGRQAAWLPPGANRPPADLAAWDHYVTAVARRYKHRIRAFQVWNEPGYPTFYTGTMDALAELTARTERALRRVERDVIVVPAPAVHGPTTLRWLAAQRRAGWPGDVHAVHLYPPPGAGLLAWHAHLRDYRRALRKARAPQRPIWVTETNFRPKAGNAQRRWSRRLVAGVQRANVARIYWYAWRRPGFGIEFPHR